ncbi:hypothetical protein PD_0940 [Xylella fastidiosa Temecula1]|uniref:Uncharacterized protein n=1 Tax=Xylella fastidiosa (strain Temecula1 / ATCC 700964) TaxID=183190 RepID=Q87CW4_XYLFT|nr:hypothetical protein PD_0940 [Xylella fastidiosa Temecula1]
MGEFLMVHFIRSVYSKYALIRSFFYFPFATLFINFLFSCFLLMLACVCLVLLVLVQPTSGFQDYFFAFCVSFFVFTCCFIVSLHFCFFSLQLCF